jgi:ABC-type multidrug transport system ATPase subunit
MIELNQLQKVVGRSVVLDIDSLLVSAGDIVAIIGPGDSGMLELLALLAGQSPTSARYGSLAQIRYGTEKSKPEVGVLFQENGLYRTSLSAHNLVFYCQLRGLPTARADDVLDQSV